ncbi:sigma-70 family RNA polymerase sigma factor [Metabacillus herbersteinensis]|uniref:Sigma-70 family RNA polymerase sigma factor n=1 Tax=Metabacillus herbersteinensis TaxID=283816 RepID=A0ABV6GBR5_9BACI
MRKLIYEYKQSLRLARRMKRNIEKIDNQTEQDQLDNSLINSMISDLEFSIEWLETGRRPGAMRGADKVDVYVTDAQMLDKLEVQRVVVAPSEDLTSDYQNELIEDALCMLTRRERDVFTLIRAEGLSFENTAELLGVTKSSVQTYLDRAEKKIHRRKDESLFLVS